MSEHATREPWEREKETILGKKKRAENRIDREKLDIEREQRERTGGGYRVGGQRKKSCKRGEVGKSNCYLGKGTERRKGEV